MLPVRMIPPSPARFGMVKDLNEHVAPLEYAECWVRDTGKPCLLEQRDDADILHTGMDLVNFVRAYQHRNSDDLDAAEIMVPGENREDQVCLTSNPTLEELRLKENARKSEPLSAAYQVARALRLVLENRPIAGGYLEKIFGEL